MAGITYLDFDLLIKRESKGYRAQIVESPAGEASAVFEVPFSELEIENFILKVGRHRQKMRRVDTPEINAAKVFGERLFRSVFKEDISGCLRSSIDEANRQGCGLRVRLRLTDVPELANLPWEYLYNAPLNRFLAISNKTPLVRCLEIPERIRPLAVSPPLQIMVMISSPSDEVQLDVEREWTNLCDALGELQQCDLVRLRRLDEATHQALQRELRRGQYHIFHFIGHGGFDEESQDGLLILEDQDGKSVPMSGTSLGTLLNDHSSMRLAVLNACEGARGACSDAFSGVAQSLSQQGVPAVIAMQFEISDKAAICFAHEFYRALADDYPVDAALTEARKSIYNEGIGLEWGTPALYMRSTDGRIFDVQHHKVPLKTVEQADSPARSLNVTPLASLSTITESERKKTFWERIQQWRLIWGGVVLAMLIISLIFLYMSRSSPKQNGGQNRPKPDASPEQAFKFEVEPNLTRHQGYVFSVAFSPDGKLLASGSQDRTVILWNAHSWEFIRTLEGHGAAVNWVAFSPDNKTIASASNDGTIRLWDSQNGDSPKTLTGHRDEVYFVAFSPDGETLVSASKDKTVKLWNIRTRELKKDLKGHTDIVWSVTFSPSGDTIASASADKTIRLWGADGKLRRKFTEHAKEVSAVAFSPDGKFIASGDNDNKIKIWDPQTGKVLQTLVGHTSYITSLVYSRDSTILVSGSSDNTVRFWNPTIEDSRFGDPLFTLTDHTLSVMSICISPRGKTLVTGSKDKTIRLWRIAQPERGL